ncbi:imidazole glycerol phosphate synthase subunit HisH [Pseudidiomarina taiwanensis]|uniref:Imidazole glycerol phosphate synthase subunit HisH n=1 Tax=Pseudidiomarina taiwanensis TaxID=337250 RepID=A0A432ZNX5_9GAMM|nr:imidazole glycerol phosphate synthase subunit HisH [Pseudidiomarina taiwanensis]RUO79583.1 imidazole glycerol phosphate synthase subunit HisH [Pseudidiomarina taiwanensis]
MTQLVIVDTACANLSSVRFACERLGVEPVLSNDPAVIKAASHVILPGVGTAKAAMRNLHQLGLVETLQQLTQPVLGICLGMQLLGRWSAEGEVECLGVIDMQTERLQVTDLPLPHMGWNTLNISPEHPLLRDIPDSSWVYFVHSYAVPVGTYTIASCQYQQPFSAIVQHQNFYGAQFHPERSSQIGAQLIQNFLELS